MRTITKEEQVLIKTIQFDATKHGESLNTWTINAPADGELVINIGSDKHCLVQLPEGLASRMHAVCVISQERDSVTFLDLGNDPLSTVNGTDAPKRVLKSGDVIGIGDVAIRVIFNPEDEEVSPESKTEDSEKAGQVGVESPKLLEEMTRDDLLALVRELQAEVEYLRRVKNSIDGYLTLALTNARTQVLLTESVQTLLRTPRSELEEIRTLLMEVLSTLGLKLL